ncbi:hypothetical protein [Acinetobacter baumannii]
MAKSALKSSSGSTPKINNSTAITLTLRWL